MVSKIDELFKKYKLKENIQNYSEFKNEFADILCNLLKNNQDNICLKITTKGTRCTRTCIENSNYCKLHSKSR